VIEGGISPDYFLDEMTDWELEAIASATNKRERGEWERCRFLAYVTACSMGAKIKTPQDLIKFQWEESTPEYKPGKLNPDLIKQFEEELQWQQET
jgi:hypothetical protein